MKKNMVIEFKEIMDAVQVRPMCDNDDVMLSFIKMSAKQKDMMSDLYYSKIASKIASIKEEYESIKEEYNHLKDTLLSVIE